MGYRLHKQSERQNSGNHPFRTAERKTHFKKRNSVRDLGQYQVYQHLHYGGSQKEKRERKGDNVFIEITVENVSNLKKEIDIQVQRAQRTQTR